MRDKQVIKSNSDQVILFSIISGTIAALISLILVKVNDAFQSAMVNVVANASQSWGIALIIIGILIALVTYIMKKKYFSICFLQVAFLGIILWLTKYFWLDSTLKIAGGGVAKYFNILVQAGIWLYIIGLIVFCIISIRKKK